MEVGEVEEGEVEGGGGRWRGEGEVEGGGLGEGGSEIIKG